MIRTPQEYRYQGGQSLSCLSSLRTEAPRVLIWNAGRYGIKRVRLLADVAFCVILDKGLRRLGVRYVSGDLRLEQRVANQADFGSGLKLLRYFILWLKDV